MGVEENGRVATINFLDEVTLTGDFDDNTSDAYRISPFTQLEFAIGYTMDAAESGNAAIVKPMFSDDGTEFYDYSIASDQSPSGGVVKSLLYTRVLQVDGTAGTLINKWYAIPTSAKYVKVAAMEDGLSSNGGVLTVKARVSNDLTLR